MSNEKGGLVKKKQSTMMSPAPVKKTQELDFGYNETVDVKTISEPVLEPVLEPVAAPATESVSTPAPAPTQKSTRSKKVKPLHQNIDLLLKKSNGTKSLKVPSLIHSEINLIGTFIDEGKSYVILQKLIDSYIKNELTSRQQRQFKFMVDEFEHKK